MSLSAEKPILPGGLKGTYYENNTFPGIWGVCGLWCSHAHTNFEKSPYMIFSDVRTFQKQGYAKELLPQWGKLGGSPAAPGVPSLSPPELPDCRRAPPAGATETRKNALAF